MHFRLGSNVKSAFLEKDDAAAALARHKYRQAKSLGAGRTQCKHNGSAPPIRADLKHLYGGPKAELPLRPIGATLRDPKRKPQGMAAVYVWRGHAATSALSLRRHQASRPPPAMTRPGRPAPTVGPGTVITPVRSKAALKGP